MNSYYKELYLTEKHQYLKKAGSCYFNKTADDITDKLGEDFSEEAVKTIPSLDKMYIIDWSLKTEYTSIGNWTDIDADPVHLHSVIFVPTLNDLVSSAMAERRNMLPKSLLYHVLF